MAAFAPLPRSKIGFAPHVDGIEGAEESIHGRTRLAQLVGYGSLQQVSRPGVFATIQRNQRTDGWHVIEADRRVLGEGLFQVIHEDKCLGGIA